MKALPWIVAGVGIGAALIYIITNAPEQQFSTGDPDLDRFANKSDRWGAKQRVQGAGGSLVGKAKEAFGNATGDDDTAASGVADQVTGSVRDVAGKAANAVGGAIRDLNR